MKHENKKDLEKLLDLLMQLSSQVGMDKSTRDESYVDLLNELKLHFNLIENEKIKGLVHHLDSELTERHVLNIIIPIERELKKNITDLDLQISTQDKLQSGPTEKQPLPCIFVLDNIRSSFNVGSIIRNFDGLNGEAIYFTGYTSTPENEQVKKTSMGAHEKLSYKYYSTLLPALTDLRAQGYQLIAIETAQPSKSIYDSFSNVPSAFIFGNERFGLDAETLKICDEVRHIPLQGFKNSLNVAVASALVGFEWRRQFEAS